MKNQKIRIIGIVAVAVLWSVLAVFAWIKPAQDISTSERRPLEQFPTLSTESILSGKFMTDFEKYTLDQFPGRDSFRQLKSLFHYYVLGQKDNNDIYIADGSAAQLVYPMSQGGVDKATERFAFVYETYLKDTGSSIVNAIVPDKGYYLAVENGYPAMDYNAMFQRVESAMPWATHVNLTDCLTAEDYYRTDTHWRQEAILPAAQKLCQALGVTAPTAGDYTEAVIERPFYGVYHGQAALPMKPDAMRVLHSQVLDNCRVYSYETDSDSHVYDMEKLDSRDLYDVYLSGPQALLMIENPRAATDRELVVFRDSFGSSMVPLLVHDYRKVTVVDLRYIAGSLLGEYIDFNGQDVLFLHSTLVLNNGHALK